MFTSFVQVFVDDPVSALLFQPPGSQSVTSTGVAPTQTTPSLTTRPSFPSPVTITIEENAATAQHILDEYNRTHTVPPVRKDLNYGFPEGLFTNEVNLVESEYPYRHLLQELDNPEMFTELFNPVPANPFQVSNAFQDLDLFD